MILKLVFLLTFVTFACFALSTEEGSKVIPSWTHVEVLLDRSGSMYSTREDALGGYNSMLEKMKQDALQKKEQETRKLTWTLNMFNHQYKPGEPQVISECKALGLDDYTTNGNTALLDSTGKMLMDLEEKLKDENVQVLVMIITDGQENASKEWTNASVKKLVTRLEEQGWKFIFSAANQDAFTEGTKYGFKANQNFKQTKRGYQTMFASNARNVESFMKSGSLVDFERNKENKKAST